MVFGKSKRLIVAVAVAVIAMGAAALSVGRHRARLDAIMRMDPETILANRDLAALAIARGKTAFAEHCVSCHGPAGRGDAAKGAPDLGDAEHLYGSGRVSEIEEIALHGIRAGTSRGWNLASMPAFATARPYQAEAIPPLRPSEIGDVTQFVLSLSGRQTDTPAAKRGAILYGGRGGCYDCHDNDGRGDSAIGAPDLIDAVWLYGDGSPAEIARSIAYGRAGISPAFSPVLSALQARAIAVYVASLSRAPTQRPAR